MHVNHYDLITFLESRRIGGIESHSTQILVVKFFFGTNNDYIVKWNVKARKKDKRNIRSKRIAMKKGVLNDSWFKPILRKFNNKVSPYAYARRHVFHSTTLNNHKTIYEHEINSRRNN
jgi:hypothetical protein